jgi:hypothetical protein
LGTGAIVLLVAQAFCAPHAAWAGCDHLAGSQYDPFRKVNQLDPLIFGATPSPAAGELPQFPPGVPAPGRRGSCSGPSCSSRIPLPVSTASERPNDWNQWGSLAVIVVIDATSQGRRAVDEPAPAAASEKSAIFHPPRA